MAGDEWTLNGFFARLMLLHAGSSELSGKNCGPGGKPYAKIHLRASLPIPCDSLDDSAIAKTPTASHPAAQLILSQPASSNAEGFQCIEAAFRAFRGFGTSSLWNLTASTACNSASPVHLKIA